jgi:hypothetical protein
MNKNLLANESKRTGKPLSNRSRKIAIVGAGQAGLQLGVSLLERGGYDVTLLSDRSADAMASGRLQATAIMYHDKCRYEEALGLNFWDLAATPTAGFNMDVRDAGGGRQLSFGSPFQDGKGVAIDYRLKFPAWMREFERRGGELIIHSADMRDLETLRSENDLVLIASGKGGIQELFERDPDRSPPYRRRRSRPAVAIGAIEHHVDSRSWRNRVPAPVDRGMQTIHRRAFVFPSGIPHDEAISNLEIGR